MMRPVLLIARHTWTEAVRSRVFSVFGLIALGLVGGSLFLTQFHFGSAELRFIHDLGQGSILLFGSVLVVTLGAQLFFREIDQRTVLPILARPVNRHQFLLGKYLGALLPILLFTLGILLVTSLLLVWRSDSLAEDVSLNALTLEGILSDTWRQGLLQALKFLVLAAMVFAVASFATSFTYTVSMGFALFFASHLVHLANDFYGRAESLAGRTVAFVLGHVLPDFRVFNEPGPDASLAGVSLYAALYAGAFLVLALLFFRQREL